MKQDQQRTFVYQGNEVLAWQQQSGTTQTIAWEHRDMSNTSVTISGLPEGSKGAELEPLGMDAGAFHLIAPPPPAYRPPLKEARSYPGFADASSSQCKMDFIDVPCDMARSVIQSEAGVQCPNNDCGRGWGTDQTEAYYANNDGYSGYLPADARYYGKGQYHSASKSSRANNDELAGVIILDKSQSIVFSGGFTQNVGPQSTIPQDLIDAAKIALQQKSCRDLFSSGVDPIKLLDELASGNSSRGIIDMANLGSDRNAATDLMLGSRTVTGADGRTFRQSTGPQPNTAHITLNTNIGAQAVTKGRFGLSDLQNKALTLIHELGHAANKIFGAGSSVIMDDNALDKAILSRMNAYWVLNKCFKSV